MLHPMSVLKLEKEREANKRYTIFGDPVQRLGRERRMHEEENSFLFALTADPHCSVLPIVFFLFEWLFGHGLDS